MRYNYIVDELMKVDKLRTEGNGPETGKKLLNDLLLDSLPPQVKLHSVIQCCYTVMIQ